MNRLSSTLALCALTLLTSQLRAAEPSEIGIRDKAGLFSTAAILHAQERIAALQRDYDFALVIESYSLGEAEQKKLGSLKTQRERARYLVALGKDRAQAAEMNGLHILLVPGQPAGTEVQVTENGDNAVRKYSRFQQKRLRDFIFEKLNGRQHTPALSLAAEAAAGFGARLPLLTVDDAALDVTLGKMRDTLQDRIGDPNAISWIPLSLLIVGIVSLWIVLAIVRRQLAAGSSDVGILGCGVPTHAPAFLAAQFGTPSAAWIYDQLFFGPPPNPLTLEDCAGAIHSAPTVVAKPPSWAAVEPLTRESAN